MLFNAETEGNLQPLRSWIHQVFVVLYKQLYLR